MQDNVCHSPKACNVFFRTAWRQSWSTYLSFCGIENCGFGFGSINDFGEQNLAKDLPHLLQSPAYNGSLVCL